MYVTNFFKSIQGLRLRFLSFLIFCFILFLITYLVIYQNELIVITFKSHYLKNILNNDTISNIISQILNLLNLEDNKNNQQILILYFIAFIVLLVSLVSSILLYFSIFLILKLLNFIYQSYSIKSFHLFSCSFFDIDRKISFSEKKDIFDIVILTHYDDFKIWINLVDFKKEIYPVIQDINDPVLIEEELHQTLLKLNTIFVDLFLDPTNNIIIPHTIDTTSNDILNFGIALFLITLIMSWFSSPPGTDSGTPWEDLF